MIAKLIVWDRDRDTALARMRKALAQYRVVGVQNNVEFLARLVTCPSFAKADLDTGLIDRENTLLFPPVSAVPELAWLLAALAEMLHEAEAERKYAGPDRESLWRTLDGWRLNGHSQRSLSLRLGEVQQSIGISQISGGWELTIADRAVFARGELGVNGQLHAQIGERRLTAAVVIAAERRHVFLEGHVYPMVRVNTLHVGGQGEEAGSGFEVPDARQGHCIAGRSRHYRATKRAAAGDGGHEDGAHDHRPDQGAAQGVSLRAGRPGCRWR